MRDSRHSRRASHPGLGSPGKPGSDAASGRGRGHRHGLGHAHGHATGGDRPLTVAVGLNVLLTVAELVGGLAAGSLALIADALHNLNDAAALVVALAARRIARRPADRKRTFGYRRAEIVAALINQTALIIVGLYLVYEAVLRLGRPHDIGGLTMIVIGGIAFAVDVGTAALTWAQSRESLNVKAAFVHNVADALGSVAVVVAGLLIRYLGWWWADLVATLLVAAYVIWQGVAMMRQGAHILIEGAPPGLDLAAIGRELARVDGVVEAHHLHVWQLDEHQRALEVHLVVDVSALADAERIKYEARNLLRDRHDIAHSTVEIEPRPTDPGRPIQIDAGPDAGTAAAGAVGGEGEEGGASAGGAGAGGAGAGDAAGEGEPGGGPVEIERKWLVEAGDVPADLERRWDVEAVEIEQGYLVATDDASVRLRRAGDRLVLTVKTGRDLARGEREVDLDGERFEALWPGTAGRRLRKTRYRVPLDGAGGAGDAARGDAAEGAPEGGVEDAGATDGLVAELDVYHDALSGLRTVEVEFASVARARAFRPPAWFGREVTEDPAYRNSRLADDGLP